MEMIFTGSNLLEVVADYYQNGGEDFSMVSWSTGWSHYPEHGTVTAEAFVL